MDTESAATESDSRTAALKLAAYGYRVFRTHSKTLRPLRKGWTESASCDYDTVYKDFTGPDGESVSDNVAVLTGDSLFVVDVDVKKKQPGLKSFADLVAEGLPENTFTVSTPSGGKHLYFKVDPAAGLAGGTEWRPGVDIRAHHGYVNAPGSIKPPSVDEEGVEDKGGAYEIVIDMPRADLAALPEKFVADLKRKKQRDAVARDSQYEDEWAIAQSVEYLQTAEPDAGPGNHHMPMVRIAQRLYDFGITPPTAVGLIEDYLPWAAEFNEPLDYQLETIATSRENAGHKWGSAHPRARPSAYLTFARVYLANPADEGPRKSAAGSALEPRAIKDPSLKRIPRRPWIVDGIAARGFVTALIAEGGIGKTQWLASFLTAVATGQEPILNEPIPKRAKAWYWNQEDDEDELDRRLAAVRIHHNLSDADFVDEEGKPMLFVNSGTHFPFLLAKRAQSGALIESADVLRIVAMLRKHEISVFAIDPIVEFHEGEENDNVQMKKVWAIARSIAEQADCAVIVAAHSKKPPEASSDGFAGDMNSLRGASSQSGVVRVAFTLLNMSAKDALACRVKDKDRHLFVKLNDAKQNLKLKTGAARWLKRVSVDIDPNRPEGLGPEMVGCLVPVTFEDRVNLEAAKPKGLDCLELLAASLRARPDPLAEATLNEIVDGSLEGVAAFPGSTHRASFIRKAVTESGHKPKGKVTEIPLSDGALILTAKGAGSPIRVRWRSSG